MGDVFTTLDLVIFFVALVGVMLVGLIAGRKEETSEDYFLAGRKIPWWGVAGSIFGSNVSANHMVGMMGIGFSIGFAQSHFELGAILGLMLLCYGFLPVYRKLKIYTLSEYLGRRYDDRSQISYAVIMVFIMAVVQMVPGLYIGARTSCFLLGGNALIAEQEEQVTNDAAEDAVDGETVTESKTVFRVNETYYVGFVLALAVISASYTIFGGLKAVIWTDVMQSVLMLAAGILVAYLTFQELGGWGAMRELDAAGADKMHLYLPVNHSQLPWTGVFTGLMAMHCFYWGTNQFIVQRALGARSDQEARLGIVAAGFLKMLIPFFAIGAGVAAFYLFKKKLPDQAVDPDTAFSELVKLVIPLGSGIIGLISAGLIGAILSSIDSMMNSAATIITIDVYKKYINPDASDKKMIFIGRVSIVVLVVIAAWMAIFVLDPNSKKNFFLEIADYQNYLTPGILVAFIMGMFWRRGTGTAGFSTILAAIFFSWLTEKVYNGYLGQDPDIAAYFGEKLNFFHRVVVVISLCVLNYVIVSLMGTADPEKSRLVWSDLGGHKPQDLRNLLTAIVISLVVFAILGTMMVYETISPTVAAWTAAIWTLGMYQRGISRRVKEQEDSGEGSVSPVRIVLADDRFWASVLCALAIFMHFYFY